ncbi:hypothetical protein E6C60_2163 [Paenibacillus algicola]|uniref:Uncharacterized protein n=1 Tax=Paenibacillus algicola TaxID=2565926 RepID=A0A4P8XKD9_9BACL|nr:hypothetical protein E6C60_2163 [Paenibacillus algicola]
MAGTRTSKAPNDEQRSINLVLFIVISLSFIYGFGKELTPEAPETIIP